MADITETPKKIFANPEGSNQKQKEIARLRSVALDEQESPSERLAAAARLLSRFGPSKRNVIVINGVVKLYISGHEFSVTERAQKLKAKLLKAKGLKEVAETELPEDPETATTEEVMPAIIAGVSASEVPKSSPLTIDAIHQVIRKFAGALPCDAPLDVTTLSVGKQNHIIEELVHKTERCLSVPDIQLVIDELKPSASSFPGLIQAAQRYLEVTRDLLAMLNAKRTGV